MNWPKVCMPKHLGGLGIPNLQLQSIAFRVRWLWQNVTDQSKPWSGLPLPVDGVVRAVFHASTAIIIRNGEPLVAGRAFVRSLLFPVQAL